MAEQLYSQKNKLEMAMTRSFKVARALGKRSQPFMLTMFCRSLESGRSDPEEEPVISYWNENSDSITQDSTGKHF